MEPIVVLAVSAPAGAAVAAGGWVAVIRTVRICRRIADDSYTRAFSLVPGRRGDAARARRRLAITVRATRDALHSCQSAGRPVGDAPSLVRQLSAAAAPIDADLALLVRERDPRVHDRVFPVVLGEADGLTGAAAELRGALLSRRDAPGVAELVARARLEAHALRP